MLSLGMLINAVFASLSGTGANLIPEFDLSSLASPRGFTMTGGGSSVSNAGDLNGDGIGDIIIGAYWRNSYAGVTTVVFGKKSSAIPNLDLSTFTTGRETGFRIYPAGPGGYSGYSVSKAGDVNGDGVDDVVMGAVLADTSGIVDVGISYVIFGRRVLSAADSFTDIQLSDAAMGTDVGFRIIGASASDSAGGSVSCAGDINGDGIDDIIVSTDLLDNPAFGGNNNAGGAYVVFGRNMTGSAVAFGDVNLLSFATGSTLGFRILGAAIGDGCGYSVSSAGDINRDGVSDLIIGAIRADPPNKVANSDAGIVYIIYGRKVTGIENQCHG